MKEGDVFSWGTFEDKMQRMLENVAKKEDLATLQKAVQEVVVENTMLRKEVEGLKAKMERIEKCQRRSNVIFTGLNGTDFNVIKNEISDICRNTLNLNVNIVRIINFRRNNRVLVELETAQQAQNIIVNSAKLNGSGVFVQRDYTEAEREKMYQLRKLKNVIKNADSTARIKFFNTDIMVNGRRLEWKDGGLFVQNERDFTYVKELLNKIGAIEYADGLKCSGGAGEPMAMNTRSTRK